MGGLRVPGLLPRSGPGPIGTPDARTTFVSAELLPGEGAAQLALITTIPHLG